MRIARREKPRRAKRAQEMLQSNQPRQSLGWFDDSLNVMSIRPASDRVGIYLEPIALAHAPAIQTLASDARIAATSNVPHPYPLDGAVTWIRYTMAQRELGREVNFAVMSDEEAGRPATVVGVCGVLNIAGAPRRGELGYWIGVPYWGRGYATAAAKTLVRIVFE